MVLRSAEAQEPRIGGLVEQIGLIGKGNTAQPPMSFGEIVKKSCSTTDASNIEPITLGPPSVRIRRWPRSRRRPIASRGLT